MEEPSKSTGPSCHALLIITLGRSVRSLLCPPTLWNLSSSMGEWVAPLPKTWLSIARTVGFKSVPAVASGIPWNRMLFWRLLFLPSAMRSWCWQRPWRWMVDVFSKARILAAWSSSVRAIADTKFLKSRPVALMLLPLCRERTPSWGPMTQSQHRKQTGEMWLQS